MKTQNKTSSSPSRTGAESELKACLWLLKKGFDVFRNVSPSGPADLIAFKEGNVIKIDVKTASFSPTGNFSFHRRSTEKARKLGVEILYVLKNGECVWACEADKNHNHDYNRTCPECGTCFVAKNPCGKFCSKKCRMKNWSKKQR